MQGTLALDDAFVAGRIVELLGWERTDAAVAAARLASTWIGAEEAFRASKSGRNLMENAPELEEDIPFCARESVLDVVPRLVALRDGAAEIIAVIVNRDPKVRGPYTAFAEVAERLRARPPRVSGRGGSLAGWRRAGRRRRSRCGHGEAHAMRSSPSGIA